MKKFILLVLIFILYPFFGLRITNTPAFARSTDGNLAQCLSNKGFTMYGEYGCSSCELQKNYFGESFKNITYVDCSQNQSLCKSKHITGYPTWIDRSGKSYKGAIPLLTLASLSNCSTDPTVNNITSGDSNRFFPSKSQLVAAFFAGLISFLAPCLLPLFPSYFSIITGFTFAQLYGLNFEKIRPRVFFSSIFFCLGFILVFTLLGATGSFAGQFITKYQNIFMRLSGFILVGLGLTQTGILKIHALQFDYAWNIQRRLTKLGFVTAFATGITAALCWIPCIGPLLAPILLLSANSDRVFQGAFLLFVYSLGLTFPFLLGGLYFPNVVKNLQENRKTLHLISVGSGIFLIAFGIFIILNLYPIFTGIFSGWIKSLSTLQPGI